MFAKRFFFAAIIIGILVAAVNAQTKFGNRVPAQTTAARPASQSPQTDNDDQGGRIEGTWRSNPDIFSDVKGLYTFGAGRDANEGTAIHHTNFSFVPSPSCINEQGVWKRVGNRKFISTVEAFCWDPFAGFAPAGSVKIRAAITVNRAGTQLDGTTTIEIFDVDGNLLFSANGPVHAVRMQAEAPAP